MNFLSELCIVWMRIISVVLVMILLLGLLYQAGEITRRKASIEKWNSFFDEENDYDLFLVGNSHIMDGVLPQVLWSQYGITSYNLASGANTIETSYWTLMNALDYHTPKVVVIDCFGSMFGDIKTSTAGISYVHDALDAFPLTTTKIKSIFDLMDDPAFDEMIANGEVEHERGRDVISFLWDFSIYHTRWDNLQKSDFELNYSNEKGAKALYQVAVPAEHPEYSINYEPWGGNNLGAEYLRNMIKELQDRDIVVVLTYIPFPATEAHIRECNTIKIIAEEYNCDFLNFLDIGVIDYSTDMADPTAHVNVSGAQKVTIYLGETLQSEYPQLLIDHRGESSFVNWDYEYNVYLEEYNTALRQQKDINIYLMMLSNREYGVRFVDSTGEWLLLQDDSKRRFIENAGFDLALSDRQLVLDNCSDLPQVSNDDFDSVVTCIVYDRNGNMLDTVTFSQQDGGAWCIEHK